MICQATKTNGEPCKWKARKGSKYCGVHKQHDNVILLKDCLLSDDNGLNYMNYVDDVLKRLEGTREHIDNKIKELEIEPFDMDTLTDQMNFMTSVFNAGLDKEKFDDKIINKAKYIFVNGMRDIFNITIDAWNLTL